MFYHLTNDNLFPDTLILFIRFVFRYFAYRDSGIYFYTNRFINFQKRGLRNRMK